MPLPVIECKTQVAAVRRLTAEILEVDLAMREPAEFTFEAGQWVSVPLGPKTVRAYTITSTPASRSQITLCADVTPGGTGSRWFRALAPGQVVEFKGPTGGFVFNRADPRRPLFVAEEIGIVPIRPILGDLYQAGFGRPATLIYWGRDPRGSPMTASSGSWPGAIRPSSICRWSGRRSVGGRARKGGRPTSSGAPDDAW